MRWRIITKDPTSRPLHGTYRDWKTHLAMEASHQCVYCCIPESRFGGVRNFHVEHWRPKSIFRSLENEYDNLFYACAVCNTFKGDDWPNEPNHDDLSVIAYPNPALFDYNRLLAVDLSSGIVESDSAAGQYIIERVFLNRPQMVALRAMTNALEQIRTAKDFLYAAQKRQALNGAQLQQITDFLFRLTEFLERLWAARPYEPDQIRR